MGAVFASAARAPLTSVASVVEMTGDYTLTLPVMLAVAVATATSRALSYGTIYTTKLLRRGQDIDRAAPWRAFGDLKAAEAMRPFRTALPVPDSRPGTRTRAGEGLAQLPGDVVHEADPQVVYSGESLTQTLRQLAAYGRDGLPVLSGDGTEVLGWITNSSVLHTVAARIGSAPPADLAAPEPARSGQQPGPAGSGKTDGPPTPLSGYRVLEVAIGPESPAAGRPLGSVSWPHGSTPVALLHERTLQDPDPARTLAVGDRVSLLTPAGGSASSGESHGEHSRKGPAAHVRSGRR
jgi:CIC family chloride channel protein